MNPGGHALSRRVSELRAAQQALAAEAWALEQAAFALLAAGNHFTGATAERRDLPWPRWPSCGGAWPCSTTCWAGSSSRRTPATGTTTTPLGSGPC